MKKRVLSKLLLTLITASLLLSGCGAEETDGSVESSQIEEEQESIEQVESSSNDEQQEVEKEIEEVSFMDIDSYNENSYNNYLLLEGVAVEVSENDRVVIDLAGAISEWYVYTNWGIERDERVMGTKSFSSYEEYLKYCYDLSDVYYSYMLMKDELDSEGSVLSSTSISDYWVKYNSLVEAGVVPSLDDLRPEIEEKWFSTNTSEDTPKISVNIEDTGIIDAYEEYLKENGSQEETSSEQNQ